MAALVVLPGLDGTATLHSGFSNAASRWFEPVAIIPYPSQQPLGYSEIEVLVRAALPTVAPFLLLGESFSGPIALSIAANPPPNLVGLVLSTSFGNSPFWMFSPLAAFTRFAPVRSVPHSLLSWLLLGRWATPELEASLQSALRSVSPAVLRSRAATALRAKLPSLAAVSVPVLYLRATQDRLLSPSAGEHLVSSIPQCTLTDIAGPHLLLQAAPQACASAIGDFGRHLG
jgi:pimeloyl-ACP methyl ester carboxylesterase